MNADEPDRDEVARVNREMWEAEVEKGCGYTIPWLDLDVSLLRRYARGEPATLPEPFFCIYPAHLLRDVEGKHVLCLATGGGQQSAVFGVLGARVTVVDLAEGQLRGDRRAAAHHGYDVVTLRADMRDLSDLPDRSFDLVWGSALTWVPDVREVYAGVARVLRVGGLFRVDERQPALHVVEWDGEAYRIPRPYIERVLRPADGGIEFRHDMEDLFGGLLESGFSIRSVHEAPYARRPDPEATPGSWDHERGFVGGEFAIVAERTS